MPLDPALTPDPKAARQAIEDTAFTRDPEDVAASAGARYRQIAEAETLAAWRAQAAADRPSRTSVAAKMLPQS